MSNRFLTLVNGVRRFVTAIGSSAGAGDANKIIATNSSGKVDNSFIAGTTEASFQLQSGSSGARIKNSGGTIEARNAADSAYANVTCDRIEVTANGFKSWISAATNLSQDRSFSLPNWAGILLTNATYNIGDGFYTRSVNPPNSPFLGLTWEEINADGSPRYGWVWAWDGTYWRSPDFYWDGDWRSQSAAIGHFFRANADFNFHIKELAISTFCSVAQNSTNRWIVYIQRRNASNTIVDINSISTAGNAANTWVRQTVSVNTHVNISSTSCFTFAVQATPFNSAGNITVGNFQVIYNFARI